MLTGSFASGWMVLSAVGAGLAVAFSLPVAAVTPGMLPVAPVEESRPEPVKPRASGVRRGVISVLAGLSLWFIVGGPVGVAAGVVGAVMASRVLSKQEPADVRRERETAIRELPHLVGLLSGPLHAGLSVESALQVVCRALPGAAASRFAQALGQLRVGTEPARVWSELATDSALAPLGRALARTHVTGASVVDSIEALATELSRSAFAEVEDRARRVGVKAAVPLGLCLLPAFLLLGIVPLVAGLMSTVLR